MTNDLLILIPIFFLIATVYSSAGFGGGSSYLAILSLFSIEFTTIRILALLCNIAVVTGSVWIFYKKGFLKITRLLPLVSLSIPFAFLGGQVKISQNVFFIILGVTLLVASLLMMISKPKKPVHLPRLSNAVIGSSIGFLSGVVGIGGGIFLSPLLYLSRWAKAKVIAATTATFILFNSIAGLMGQILSVGFQVDFLFAALLIIAVIAGGQIGARFTAGKVNPLIVRRMTSVLIFIVALRILWKYVPAFG